MGYGVENRAEGQLGIYEDIYGNRKCNTMSPIPEVCIHSSGSTKWEEGLYTAHGTAVAAFGLRWALLKISF